jgi:hypothetical protein
MVNTIFFNELFFTYDCEQKQNFLFDDNQQLGKKLNLLWKFTKNEF